MATSINFVDIALYCQNKFRESTTKEHSRYVNTLFVSIDENNDLLVSETPHILHNATKCILIHCNTEQAVTNWYRWYKVEFINENGEVLDRRLDDEFKLHICSWGSYSNQRMELEDEKRSYISWSEPWNSAIKEAWALYLRLKETKTESERNLISELFRKDKHILQLEKEIEGFKYNNHLIEQEKEAYKELLDDIQKMIAELKE